MSCRVRGQISADVSKGGAELTNCNYTSAFINLNNSVPANCNW